MATMVLSAAGAAIGGPVGGAIGSFLGRQVDRSFGKGSRPRISDLRAPSAQFGDPIPSIIGRMRVGGVVLWTSEPVATATVSKSGTGTGSSVSFAYGLSTGRIDEVGRVWADGRLIRDAEGSQAVSFELRLHTGDEDQLSDPLIASIMGEDRAPAFRGIAYLVFENFDLSSFGNRLPLITVEVTEREGGVSSDSIVGSAISIASSSEADGHDLAGFASLGDDQADALAPLVEAFGTTFAYSDARWTLQRSSAHHVVDDDLWVLQSPEQVSTTLAARSQVPSRVSIRFFDPDIDFAASERSARLPGAERLKRIELPAALSRDRAKALAFRRLTEAASSSVERWLELPLSYITICLGDKVSCAARANEHFRVSSKQVKNGVLRLALRAESSAVAPIATDLDGVTGLMRLSRQPLSTVMIEVPSVDFNQQPEVAILVSGGHEPFQPLPLIINDQGSQHQLQSAAVPAVVGKLTKPLHNGNRHVLDMINAIAVTFEQGPALTSCTESALLSGANLLSVGEEFIQFATARPVGGASYILSDLIRGRFDSCVRTHDSGSPVLLLHASALSSVRLPIDRIGSKLCATAYGPDLATADTDLTLSGLNARPWAPDHVDTVEVEEGLQLSWIRRCKQGAPWLDEVEAPVGASQEAYAVKLSGQTGQVVEFTTATSSALVDAATATRVGARPWKLEIRQLGDFAAGNPRILFIN